MGIMKAQNAFDENWIMDHKGKWKEKFRELPTAELENKLRDIERHPQFDSSKSSKRSFWFGGVGSAVHVVDRERESKRRALLELLGRPW